MPFLIGLVGKPNTGKSTFLASATLTDVQIANYPFTTINPNLATGYVTTRCPCKDLNLKCKPKNSICKQGTRLIPIQIMDVPGLVPGAHKGKGLGNQFLDKLRQASGLIHIIDISGSTDPEGRLSEPGSYNPQDDISFLETELNLWFFNILKKHWDRLLRLTKCQHKDFFRSLAEKLSSLGISENMLKSTSKTLNLPTSQIDTWSEADLEKFTKKLREISKPILICANKIDLPTSQKNFERLEAKYKIPCCAEAEFALRRADKEKLISYIPGANTFKYLKTPNEKQAKALDFIQTHILNPYKSTGVQKALNTLVFDLLNMIVVYPVEDENHFSDRDRNPLPDAFLVPKNTTTLDLAYKIHTDLGKNFIGALDAQTKMKLGRDHILSHGDIIKILTK